MCGDSILYDKVCEKELKNEMVVKFRKEYKIILNGYSGIVQEESETFIHI